MGSSRDGAVVAMQVFLTVRDATGTPGGVADTTFSLQTVMAMMRHARSVVRAAREGDKTAQNEVLQVFSIAAMRGHHEQARAFLAGHLLREASMEDDLYQEARGLDDRSREARASQELQRDARDTSFVPAERYAVGAGAAGGAGGAAGVDLPPGVRPDQPIWPEGGPTYADVMAARQQRMADKAGGKKSAKAEARAAAIAKANGGG